MLKLRLRRIMAALLASAICLTSFATVSAADSVTGPDSDITNWTPIGSTVTATPDGYVLEGSNNEFALSDKSAVNFTLEAEVTALSGEGKMTFIYGLANAHDTAGWRGIELWVKEDSTAFVKAFVERGPMLLNDTPLTGLDRSKATKFKIQMQDKQLTITINDQTFNANIDDGYVGGYVGLLAYNTKAQFNHIRFTGDLAPCENSQVSKWYPVGATRFLETADHYEISNGGDAILLSNVGARTFEWSADIKIVSGDRATLTYGNADFWHNDGWRGIELLKNGDTTGQIKAFIAGRDPFIGVIDLTDMDWSGFNNLKVTMDENNLLTLYVNGNKVGEGVDDSYYNGSLGLLSWNTTAQFKNVEYSVPEGNASSDIVNWNPMDATFYETNDGFMLSGRDDNFAISDKNAVNFELSADIMPINGHQIGTLTYGNASQTAAGAWHGIEFKRVNNTIEYKSFVVNQSSMAQGVVNDLDWSVPQNVKVRVINKEAKIYVNNTEIATYTDEAYNGGYAGLLTYGSATFFNNITYRDLSETGIVSVKVAGVDATETDDTFAVTVDKADTYAIEVETVDADATVVVAEDMSSITVTAQDGTEKTYTLNVTINDPNPEPPKSSNTTIAKVTVDGVEAELTEATYTVVVEDADAHTVEVVAEDEKATAVVAEDQKSITVTAEDGTVKVYTLVIKEKIKVVITLPSDDEPTDAPSDDKPNTDDNQPAVTTPTNGVITVNGKVVLYKDGKAVTGTKVVTVSGKTYAVVKGAVATGKTRVVKVSKTKSYVVNKNGIIQKGKKNKLVKVGKKSYIVNKNGVVQKNNKKNKIVKIGSKKYIVNKAGVVYKSKTVKVGKVSYKINKKGVATKKK